MALANEYEVGDTVRVSNTFKDAAGVAADPTTVRFKYKTPAGTTTTLTYLTDSALVKDSVGNYHVDVSITETGTWRWRWEGTGTNASAAEGVFHAKRQLVS